MSITIFIQNTSKTRSIPSKQQFKTWIEKAMAPCKKTREIVIRIVGVKEITKINNFYRKKNKPTNIISFNFYTLPSIKTNFLGDLVICASIVKLEAKLQHKSIISHWAHLTIHGILHLLDHDHKNKNEAQKMEKLEIKILKNLGFPNPYQP